MGLAFAEVVRPATGWVAGITGITDILSSIFPVPHASLYLSLVLFTLSGAAAYSAPNFERSRDPMRYIAAVLAVFALLVLLVQMPESPPKPDQEGELAVEPQDPSQTSSETEPPNREKKVGDPIEEKTCPSVAHSKFVEKLEGIVGPNVRIEGNKFVLPEVILFESCSTDITGDGEIALTGLAEFVRSQMPPDVDWVLRVDGHADEKQLLENCLALYQDNLELSAERSIAVVRYLTSVGVAPDKLIAAGLDSYHPVSQSDLDVKRRIELMLMDR